MNHLSKRNQARLADSLLPDRARIGVVRSSMRWLVAIGAVLLAGIAMAGEDSAQPTSTNAAPHGASNRYLFIVDTSKGMQPRSQAMLKSVQDLLGSSMAGQMRAGDSVGIWTYDSDVHSGRFPAQPWKPEMQPTVTKRAISFLSQQTYEKSAHLAKALALLNGVMKASDYLTVIIINDGQEPITGTPFDKAINDSFKLWRQQQDAAHMPFVTILRSQKGQYTHYSVSPSPWPSEIPPLPAEFLAAKAAAAPAAPAPKPAPPTAPPLIIHGHPTNAAPVAHPEPAPTAPAASPTTSTNAATPPIPSTDASLIRPATIQEAEPIKKNWYVLLPTNPVVNPVVTNAPVEPAQNTPSTPPPEIVPQSASNSASVVTTITAPPAEAVSNSLSQPEPAIVEPPAAGSNTAASVEGSSGSGGTATTPEKAPVTTVAVASETGSLPMMVKVGIAGLATAAIGSAFLLLRRGRSSPRPSLITRSMDRHKT
jgi:hypothetical protein